MIDQEEIRKEVAVKNNVLLGKNDPILQSVTIFEKALEQAVSTLNAQNEHYLRTLLDSLKKGNEEARAMGARVISQTTTHASTEVKAAVKEAMDEGREELRKDLRLAWAKIEEARKAVYVAAGITGVCAVVTLGAMVITVA
jgi:hypothetical protein